MDVFILKCESPRAVWAKAPGSPVLLRLVLLEPLTDPQLLHLLLAGPFQPVAARIELGRFCFSRDGFLAEILSVTVPQRPRRPPARKRMSWGRTMPGAHPSTDR